MCVTVIKFIIDTHNVNIYNQLIQQFKQKIIHKTLKMQ